MQSALRTTNQLSQLFRLQSAKTGVPSTFAEVKPPLFQRLPPWWARWTWGLIACDIFLTGSAIELTWNHWSSLVTESDAKNNGQDTGPTPPSEYALRPIWQRGGLCAGHLGLGVGVIVALLVTQIRFVRTFAILPRSAVTKDSVASGPRVFLQTAHNFNKNGLVFPLNKCSLQEGRNKSEIIFRVTGERGHWHIDLENAVINGIPSSLDQARAAILGEWRGKRVGHWTPMIEADSRWKNGPAQRAER